MNTVLSFLKQLKQNNSKEWFDANKDKYLTAKDTFETMVEKLIKDLARTDKQIDPNLKVKDCVFRIYKDVRFSKDKTPYKTNMGASFNPGGKKSPTPGYYVHLEPGASFVAGGVWMPAPDALAAIRQEIDYNGAQLTKIMKAATFKTYFKGLDEIDVLKTAPKGFEKDHPMMDLLKHKHFIVSHPLSDKQVTGKDLETEVIKICKAMLPFIQFLRTAMDKEE
ncbi:MAG: DUF2461 domain-containing protein [Sediminibacterium sp.]|nr:DUF2461 domain-containing protein [Sediminibacterium sp.]